MRAMAGATHKDLPDFLVRWVRAVNAHAGFGRWAFMVCKEPERLRETLDAFAAEGGVTHRQLPDSLAGTYAVSSY